MKYSHLHTGKILSLALALCALLLAERSHAQAGSQIGTVGSRTIDQAFVNAMQVLNPEFAYTSDTALFRQRLYKSYVLVHLNADEARRQKLDQDPEVKRNLEFVKQMAEAQYLNMLMQSKVQVPAEAPKVSEDEARAYYEAHQAQFATPSKFSYFRVAIADTMANPIEDVKKQVKKLAASANEVMKIGDGDHLSIAFLKDEALPNPSLEYDQLTKLRPNTFSAPIKQGNITMLFMLMERVPEKVQPYSAVAENCKSHVLNEKQMRASDEFVKKALEKYPIHLNPNYSGQ